MSTSFLVTQAQRDLLQAQVSLLQAMLDYQAAVVGLELLQQAPTLSGTIGLRGASIVALPAILAARHRAFENSGVFD